MAFRSLIQAGNAALREKLKRSVGSSRRVVTSTTPKLKAYAETTTTNPHGSHGSHHSKSNSNSNSNSKSSSNKKGYGYGWTSKLGGTGDYAPVFVSVGLIALAVGIGLHTVKQQLFNSPSVHVKKSRRETLPEVEDPDRVADDANRFVKNSFFRKVANVQEFDTPVPDTMRGEALARRNPRVETLKSAGVDPNPNPNNNNS